MAVNLTATGVDFVSGRGKHKTVELSMTFADLEKWAKRCRIDTKKIKTETFGWAVKGLKTKLRQVVTKAGGVNGVPKFRDFEEFTKELRAKTGISGRPMGGVLADEKRIVSNKRNGYQVIGWPDNLAAWAVKFQDGGDRVAQRQLNDPGWRRAIHRRGIREIPHSYVKNPRRILPEPFGGFVKANLKAWAKGAFYKKLAKMFKKAADAAAKGGVK